MSNRIKIKPSEPDISVSSTDTLNTRTFIHIGYPKCASTYLQKTVFPAMGNFTDVNKLPRETKKILFDEDTDPCLFRDRATEALEYRNPKKDYRIVSYEELAPKLFRKFADLYWETRRIDVTRYTCSKQRVAERLAEAFPEAHIIIIIRNQIDWAISHYKMYWRRGFTSLPVDLFVDHYENGYELEIQRYIDLFGADRVSVVPYEMLLQDPANFVRSVTGFIDPSFEPIISDDRVNYAPDLLRDMYYQRAKRILKREIRDSVSPLHRFSLKIAHLGMSLAGRPYYTIRYGSKKDVVQVSDDTLKLIRPALAQSNREVERITGLNLGQYGYYIDDAKA